MSALLVRYLPRTHTPVRSCNYGMAIARRNYPCKDFSSRSEFRTLYAIITGVPLQIWKLCPHASGVNSIQAIPAEAPTPRLQHIQFPLNAIEKSIVGGNLAILRALRRRANSASLPVYLVGGPVRDLLLGRPLKDLDFVVEGDAPAVARDVAQEVGGEVITYRRFGTATVALPDCRVDVVTARRETYARPGALPDTVAGNIYEDLARRDFSINSLAAPLAGDSPLLDPQGGRRDLEKGVIRVLHAASFLDDPTRILRAVRYEQRLGFRLADETLAQMLAAVQGGALATISGDRLRGELKRILEEASPAPALARAAGLGLLATIHPALGGEANIPEHLLPAAASAGPLVYMGILAYPLTVGQAEAVVQRLNMPGEWAKVVRDTVAVRKKEPALSGPDLPASHLYHLLEDARPEAVGAAACLSPSPAARERLSRYLTSLRQISPPLDGNDLLAMGAPRGTLVGRLLRQLHDARLDGQITTEPEARLLAQQWLAQEGDRTKDG